MLASSLLAVSLALPLFTEPPVQDGELGTARLDPQVLELEAGAVAHLDLADDATYALLVERRHRHASGNVSVQGRVLAVDSAGYRFTLTGSASSGVFGTLLTPQGEYRIEPAGDAWNTVSLSHVQVPMAARQCDAQWHGPSRSVDAWTKQSGIGTTEMSDPTTLRVLVLYTDSARAGRTDAQWTAYLDDLFALTNGIYDASGTRIHIDRAGDRRVGASETLDHATMLQELTPVSGSFNRAVFGELERERLEAGAHFVMLLRGWRAEHPNCGLAHVFACGDDAQCYAAGRGYTTVSLGNCFSSIVAHELGHLLGAAHQPGDGLPGSFAYAYGHINEVPVGTVMTTNHGHPIVGLFSAPELDCQGQPCGIAEARDNARTLRQVRHYVARWLTDRSITLFDPPQDSLPRGRSVPLNFGWFGVIGERFDISVMRHGERVASLAENELLSGFRLLEIPATLPLGEGYRLRIAASTVPEVFAETGLLRVVEPASAPSEFAFSAERVTVAPGQSTVELVVRRTGGLEGTAIVHYATRDGSAVAGRHYTANISALAWEDGDGSTRSIFVQIDTSAATGVDRSFQVELLNPSTGSMLGAPASTEVTIVARPGGGGSGSFGPWVLQLLGLVWLIRRASAQSGHCPVRSKTSSVLGASVMMPSTPSSSRRCISAQLLMVQACTAMSLAWASAMKFGVMTSTPSSGGTWKA